MRIHRILPLAAILLLIYPNHAAAKQNKQKPSAAIAAWLKAAEQGNAGAQYILGGMYPQGKEVQDYAEAAKWFRKAAEQGYVAAQFGVGSMYADGRGVPQDYIQSYMWLTLSVSTDKQNQILQKAADLLDSIAKKMTPQQIAEAQRLAKEWKTIYVQRSGDGPFTVGSGGVTAPVVLVNPMPSYTEEARGARAKGIVLVQCIVRKNGRAESCKIIRGLGYGLEESAMNTIAKEWRFKPGTYNGKPADVWALIEVVFRMY